MRRKIGCGIEEKVFKAVMKMNNGKSGVLEGDIVLESIKGRRFRGKHFRVFNLGLHIGKVPEIRKYSCKGKERRN